MNLKGGIRGQQAFVHGNGSIKDEMVKSAGIKIVDTNSTQHESAQNEALWPVWERFRNSQKISPLSAQYPTVNFAMEK